MKREDNLRGQTVTFPNPESGVWVKGKVITHTRGERWLIESSRLPEKYRRGRGWWAPKRISLERGDFIVCEERS